MDGNRPVIDRRQFERYSTSFSASVHWRNHGSRAQLSDLSLGGAKFTGVSAAPHVGETVSVKLHFNGSHLEFDSVLSSRNIYTLEYEKAGSWAFGVEFHDPPGEIEEKLKSVFEDLGGD